MFEVAVERAVDEFLRNPEPRTVAGYEIEIERVPQDDVEILGFDALEVLTWGYDHQLIRLPVDWRQLIRLKMWTQINLMDGVSAMDTLSLRLYLAIMRQYDELVA